MLHLRHPRLLERTGEWEKRAHPFISDPRFSPSPVQSFPSVSSLRALVTLSLSKETGREIDTPPNPRSKAWNISLVEGLDQN
jgi:hypothetical protein